MRTEYMRHGSAVRLDRRVSYGTAGPQYDPRTHQRIFSLKTGTKYVVWLVRINGKVVNRALTYQRARELAEKYARKALLDSWQALHDSMFYDLLPRRAAE